MRVSKGTEFVISNANNRYNHKLLFTSLLAETINIARKPKN